MPKYYTIITAAGIGSRMQSAVPKQYLELQGKPVLVHTVERFLSYPKIEKIVVVLQQDDQYWPKLQIADQDKIMTANGGKERCQTVLNGLRRLEDIVKPYDWVLVQDAVRPCLTHSDLDKLINTVDDHQIGGLLGAPLVDTIKRVNTNGTVNKTMERKHLWAAFTPQMFRFQLLKDALHHAISVQEFVTDDAAAIELSGHQPLMVEGRRDNIKITYPQDLQLAEYYLSRLM